MNQSVRMNDPRKTDRHYQEAIKTLRTNLQFVGRNVKCIMATSCFPNEGKSDIVFQLAREIGNIGKRVVILDADIRKSAFANRYRIGRPVKGLTHYLCGAVSFDEIRYSTNYDNVDIIFAGSTSPSPSELLEDEAFAELIKSLRGAYDYVLVDTPPVVGMTDASIIAKRCDGAIMVVESGRVSYRIAQKAKQQLAQSGCRVLGVVLNKVDIKGSSYYSKYGYYDKYYEIEEQRE